MKREEAIKLLKQYQGYEPMFPDGETLKHAFDLTDETVDTLLTALRPVSREQVEEAWRGEWIAKHYVDGILEGTNFDECSKCGYQRVFENPELKTKYMFCPGCGRAMWDEAVQMVMERLEALKDDKGD